MIRIYRKLNGTLKEKLGKDENIHRGEKKFSRVNSKGREALVGKGKKGEREQGLRLKLILFLNATRAFNQECLTISRSRIS